MHWKCFGHGILGSMVSLAGSDDRFCGARWTSHLNRKRCAMWQKPHSLCLHQSVYGGGRLHAMSRGSGYCAGSTAFANAAVIEICGVKKGTVELTTFQICRLPTIGTIRDGGVARSRSKRS